MCSYDKLEVFEFTFYTYASFQHFCEVSLSSAAIHKHAIHLHAVCQPPFEKPCHALVDLRYNENQCSTDDTSKEL